MTTTLERSLLREVQAKYPGAKVTAINATKFRVNQYAPWAIGFCATRRVVDSFVVQMTVAGIERLPEPARRVVRYSDKW